MSPKSIVELLKATFAEWQEDKAARLAAALAYYTAFSIAPLVLLAIVIAGVVFGEEAAQGAIFAQLQGLLGQEGAAMLEAAVQNSRKPGANVLSAVIGLATLAWSASNVFAQLQEALNTIWEVEPKPGQGLVGMAKKRLLSMSMVLGIGFLLLVSLVLSAGLAALGQLFGGLLPGGEALWHVVDFVVSFAVVAALFAAIYKVLPDAEIAWGDVWVGAVVTAALFTLGKIAIGLYLGHASVGSTYGAAGSLLVLLVWIYYAAQILFFGAEFAQVYARRFGSRIVPSEGAVPLTAEAKANQGAAPKAAVERAARTGEPVEAAARSQEQAPPQPVAASSRTAEPRPVASGATVGPADGAAREPGMIKKLLWTGLAAGSLAAAGLAARRTSMAIWGRCCASRLRPARPEASRCGPASPAEVAEPLHQPDQRREPDDQVQERLEERLLQRKRHEEHGLRPNTSDLGLQDPDGRERGPRRVRRRGLGRRGLERILAHLALDRAGVPPRPAVGQPLGGEIVQESLAKRGNRFGRVRWARGMARRSTRSAPVKLRRSGSRPCWRAARCIRVRIARCASSRPETACTTARGC